MDIILLDNGGVNPRLHNSFFWSKMLPSASLSQDRKMAQNGSFWTQMI